MTVPSQPWCLEDCSHVFLSHFLLSLGENTTQLMFRDQTAVSSVGNWSCQVHSGLFLADAGISGFLLFKWIWLSALWWCPCRPSEPTEAMLCDTVSASERVLPKYVSYMPKRGPVQKKKSVSYAVWLLFCPYSLGNSKSCLRIKEHVEILKAHYIWRKAHLA
jgi:hypothetical protein